MEINTQPKDMESVWIQQASQGDLEAFNQLVLKYQTPVYNQALAILKDEWKAEDATQDCFIKAFQNIGSFRGNSFRAWLMRIVTNNAYDMFRRSARRPTQPLFPEFEEGDESETPGWLADPKVHVETEVENNEQMKNVYQAMSELQAGFRDVITLIDLQDFDYEEAAETLNIPIGTVKSRLARARLQMKKKLQTNRIVLEDRQIWIQNPIYK